MNPIGSRLETRVAEMSRLFDGSFAAPAQSDRSAVEHVLAVKVGGERLAVFVNDLSGLTVARGTILPVPSSVPELLGITGIHSVVVPVFNLAALLGIGHGSGQYRWLLLCGGHQATIALAVELVESHVEVSADTMIARSPDATARYIKQTVRDGDILRGVIDIAMLVEQIRVKGRS
jgi:chemotaxis signal transduction protein